MIDHPNVVRFEESFEDDLNIYIVMELIKGGNVSLLMLSYLIDVGMYARSIEPNRN